MTSANAPQARMFHTAVWTGEEMIVWGGKYTSGGEWIELDDGAHYNPSTDKWTTMDNTGAPSPRYMHSAVWTGNEMIVWGGMKKDSGIDSWFDDGGVYRCVPN